MYRSLIRLNPELDKNTNRCFDNYVENQEGAAASETAITIMTFLMIVLGIIQLAMVLNAKLLVNYAAYSAARAGIVHNGDFNRDEEGRCCFINSYIFQIFKQW